MESFWLGKPYYSLDAYCKHTYHEKLYKIALDAGMTCPNRDGTIGTGGCIFCSRGGSGDFAVPGYEDAPMKDAALRFQDSPAADDALDFGSFRHIRPMPEQLAAGKALFHDKQIGRRFIAYFQAYTNTYAPLPYLRSVYTQALEEQTVAGISIATRPDCIGEDVLSLLIDLQQRYPDKFIWVELGLQTIHEKTAAYIRRGYPLSVFDHAAERLSAAGIPVIVHLILGLPGETDNEMLQSVEYLNHSPVFGVKLQLLHVLKDTDLAERYEKGEFDTLTKKHYISLLLSALSRLSPKIVIHRLTGDGAKEQLIAPRFSLNKRDVLNTLHQECKRQSIWQGKEYHDTGSTYTL